MEQCPAWRRWEILRWWLGYVIAWIVLFACSALSDLVCR